MMVIIEESPARVSETGRYPTGMPVATTVRPMSFVENLLYKFKKHVQRKEEPIAMNRCEVEKSLGIQMTEEAYAQITKAEASKFTMDKPAIMELIKIP